MSMNIFLYAEIEAESKVGKHTIREMFDCWQTPTEVTKKILASEDKKQAYLDYVLDHNDVQKIPIFSVNDYFCEGDIVGYKNWYPGTEHMDDLNVWLEDHEGWTIKWEMV